MLIPTEVKAIRETPEGTELIIKINERVKDQVLRYKEGGKVLAELRINDGRTVTNEQRKKYFASLKDIADYTGNALDYMHDYFKFLYCYRNRVDNISMSSCSITEAREMINYLMEFAIHEDIPLTDLGLNRTDDIDRFLFLCLKYRKCCITGKPAQIHHVEGSRIGMGNNRRKTSNKGRKLIALCREWHTKVHQEGEEAIFEKFKIYGIVLDEYSLRSLGISKEEIS